MSIWGQIAHNFQIYSSGRQTVKCILANTVLEMRGVGGTQEGIEEPAKVCSREPMKNVYL